MSLKSRYDKLEPKREPALRRARAASELTIPSLIPPSGHTLTSILPTPYQGLGARGVNTLAAKLALILMPAGDPFFKYTIDEFVAEEIGANKKGEIDKTLAKIERSIGRAINVTGIRVPLTDSLRHLIVGGNITLGYQGQKKRFRVFYLNQVVQNFSPDHILLEKIIKETTSVAALPLSVQATTKLEEAGKKQGDDVDLYTGIKRMPDGKYKVWQEVNDIKTGQQEGIYTEENLPFLSLGWNWIDGEDYARGHVEEYYGDMKSLEELSRAIVEGSAAAAKILYFVKPSGNTSEKEIEKANGSVCTGDANDVTILGLDKFADFRIAQETSQRIEQRLQFAFLMQQAIQRDAERVTAEEIRRVAEDIDDTLGGIFSQLSEDFQLPLVKLVSNDLEKSGKLPSLPKDTVDVEILTGLEALGRSAEIQKLQAYFQLIPEPLLQQLLPRFDANEISDRIGAAVNLNTSGLLISAEEAQAGQQDAQLNEMIQKVGPEVVKQLLQAAIQQQQGGGQQPQQPQGAP